MCGKTITNLHELNEYLIGTRNFTDLIKIIIKMPFRFVPVINEELPDEYKIVGRLNDKGNDVLISNVFELPIKDGNSYLVEETMFIYYLKNKQLFKFENSRRESIFYV